MGRLAGSRGRYGSVEAVWSGRGATRNAVWRIPGGKWARIEPTGRWLRLGVSEFVLGTMCLSQELVSFGELCMSAR